MACTLVNCTNSYEKKEIIPELVQLAKFSKQHVPEQHPKVNRKGRGNTTTPIQQTKSTNGETDDTIFYPLFRTRKILLRGEWKGSWRPGSHQLLLSWSKQIAPSWPTRPKRCLQGGWRNTTAKWRWGHLMCDIWCETHEWSLRKISCIIIVW